MIKTILKAHLTYNIPVRCAFSRLSLFYFSIFLYLFHSYCYKIILLIYCIFSSSSHQSPQYHVTTFYHILLNFFSKSSIFCLFLQFFSTPWFIISFVNFNCSLFFISSSFHVSRIYILLVSKSYTTS